MWEVTVDDVLDRWVNTEAPESDDRVFLTMLEDAQGLIRDEFNDLDERMVKEPFLLSKVKQVTAKIIQRAMTADYSSYVSVSNTEGPFASSKSKESKTKQGLFLDSDDIDKLTPKGSEGGIKVIQFNPVSRGHYYNEYYW